MREKKFHGKSLELRSFLFKINQQDSIVIDPLEVQCLVKLPYDKFIKGMEINHEEFNTLMMMSLKSTIILFIFFNFICYIFFIKNKK